MAATNIHILQPVSIESTNRKLFWGTSRDYRQRRILQFHLDEKDQPAQRPLPSHRSFIEPDEILRTRARHVDDPGLDETPGHGHLVAGDVEFEVPEFEDDVVGWGPVAEGSGEDLQADDVVEVF